MAQMLSSNSRPALVPLTIASMVLVAPVSGSPSAASVRASCRSGTMIWPIRIATGAPSTEATTMWPPASGITGPRIVA